MVQPSPTEIYQLKITLKGRRAGPPEDVGGVWGYMHFLEAMG